MQINLHNTGNHFIDYSLWLTWMKKKHIMYNLLLDLLNIFNQLLNLTIIKKAAVNSAAFL